MSSQILRNGAVLAAVLFCLAPAMAQNAKPLTCDEVESFIKDGEIPMDQFKLLLIRAGYPAEASNQEMDTQCRAARVIDRVDIAKRLVGTNDREGIYMEARVVNSDGPCRVTEIELNGC